MDLEAAIQAQTKDTPPEQITELVLDTCKATKVSGLEKFSNLKSPEQIQTRNPGTQLL